MNDSELLAEQRIDELIEVNQRLWNTIGELVKIVELAHPHLIMKANKALEEIQSYKEKANSNE